MIESDSFIEVADPREGAPYAMFASGELARGINRLLSTQPKWGQREVAQAAGWSTTKTNRIANGHAGDLTFDKFKMSAPGLYESIVRDYLKLFMAGRQKLRAEAPEWVVWDGDEQAELGARWEIEPLAHITVLASFAPTLLRAEPSVWTRVLRLPGRLLDGLPVAGARGSSEMYWGIDVALSFEAALEGRSFTEAYPAFRDRQMHVKRAVSRLMSEVRLAWERETERATQSPLSMSEINAMREKRLRATLGHASAQPQEDTHVVAVS